MNSKKDIICGIFILPKVEFRSTFSELFLFIPPSLIQLGWMIMDHCYCE